MEAVTIPVMAKCRIGHFAEAQILQSMGADFIDESEGGNMISCVLYGHFHTSHFGYTNTVAEQCQTNDNNYSKKKQHLNFILLMTFSCHSIDTS